MVQEWRSTSPTVTSSSRADLQFRQSDVRLFRYQFPDQPLMRRQHSLQPPNLAALTLPVSR